MRTIRVTGKGQFKVHPDMTRITITLQGVYKEYAEALMHSSLDTEELKSTAPCVGRYAVRLGQAEGDSV